MSSILIVEDENIVAMDLSATLTRLGYDVCGTAARADAAVELARRHAPDLVLMDIMLGGDADGIQAAERIRAERPVPIVFLTAYTDDTTIGRASRTEPYGFIVKPFHDRDIKGAVEAALGKHAAETARQDREALLARAFRSIGEGVIACDTDGAVTFMNATAERLCGIAAAAAAGRPLAEVFRLVSVDTGAPVADPVSRAMATRLPALLPDRTSLVTPGGALVPIDDCAAPIIDDEGRLVGGVVVFRDSSTTRRLQSRLLLTDRMATVGLLAAGIGHELANPLAYVMADLEYALDEVGRDESNREKIADALRDARHGIDRVARIAKQLRGWARADEERPQSVQLQGLLEVALSMAWPEMRERAQLVKEYRQVPDVRVDETRITQALIVLLVNAAQAIRPGNATGNTIRVVVRRAADHVILEIHDSGPPVPPEHTALVFTPFSAVPRAGIGLAIAQGAIQASGGTVELGRDEDGGNVFTVALPAPAAAATEEPARRRVLIVDDEPLICGAIKRSLSADHDVTALQSAREALSRVVAGERWDVILLDLLMPEMSGMDLFDALDKIAPEQTGRVIFLTGGAFSKRASDFLAGGRRFVEKPFDTEELKRLVDEMPK